MTQPKNNKPQETPSTSWLSSLIAPIASFFQPAAEVIKSTVKELKSVAKKIQPLHEANKTINKLIAATLNEAPQLFPLTYTPDIKKLTNKIPHTKKKDQNNNSTLEFEYLNISDKYRELKKLPSQIATESSLDQSTPQQNIEQIAHHLYSATNFLLLGLPKTTFENLQNLYNLGVVSNSEYQPQLQQISQWAMPEAKETNALAQPVKIAHQTFYALQLLISSCKQIAFLITIKNGYSIFQQTQDKGLSYFKTFVPVFSGLAPSAEFISQYNSLNAFDAFQCDARLPLMQPPLERGYLINSIDFSWYCSLLLLTLNSLVFLYYIKTLHTKDLNLQPFLKQLLNFPEQIQKYIASEPWPAETINERKESYQYSKQFFFSPSADEKKSHTLKPAYVAAASSLYEKTQCIIPFIAKPAAEITTKLLMWGIASYLLKVKDYLRDVSIQNPGETAQLTYGLIPWLYHQSGIANALRTTFGAVPSPNNNDESYLFDAQFTGYTLRQVEIFMWVWFFSPLLFGFFQALMEKAYNRYCKLTPVAFEEKLTRVTDASLKNYYFNSDELPLVENVLEYKESKEDKNDEEDKEENEEIVGYKEILEYLPSVDGVLKPVADYLTSNNPKDIRQSAYAKLAVQYSQKIAARWPLSNIISTYDYVCDVYKIAYPGIYLTVKDGATIFSGIAESSISVVNGVIYTLPDLTQFGLNKLGYFFTSLIIDNAGVVYQGAVKMVNGMRPLRMQDGSAPSTRFQNEEIRVKAMFQARLRAIAPRAMNLFSSSNEVKSQAQQPLSQRENPSVSSAQEQVASQSASASSPEQVQERKAFKDETVAAQLARLLAQNKANRINYLRSLQPPPSPNFNQQPNNAPLSPPPILPQEDNQRQQQQPQVQSPQLQIANQSASALSPGQAQERKAFEGETVAAHPARLHAENAARVNLSIPLQPPPSSIFVPEEIKQHQLQEPAVNITLPCAINNYIDARNAGKKYEAFRLFMTKQRKVAAAESLKTPDNTPGNNWDFNALCHGNLKKITKTYRADFKGTELQHALDQHEKAVENLRKFRKLSPAL